MSSFGTCNHLNEFKVVFDQKKATQFCQNLVFHKVSERQALLGLFAVCIVLQTVVIPATLTLTWKKKKRPVVTMTKYRFTIYFH